MGYTHYWEFKKAPRGEADKTEALYQKAIEECAKIARTWNAKHPKGTVHDTSRLSGFTAHTKAKKYGGIELNGKGDLSHEPFVMREHYSQNLEEPFQFCKTARKPYDTVVTACLAVLQYRLGDLIKVSSDGDKDDWSEGVEFARQVLGRAIPNPMQKGPVLSLVKGGKAA